MGLVWAKYCKIFWKRTSAQTNIFFRVVAFGNSRWKRKLEQLKLENKHKNKTTSASALSQKRAKLYVFSSLLHYHTIRNSSIAKPSAVNKANRNESPSQKINKLHKIRLWVSFSSASKNVVANIQWCMTWIRISLIH